MVVLILFPAGFSRHHRAYRRQVLEALLGDGHSVFVMDAVEGVQAVRLDSPLAGEKDADSPEYGAGASPECACAEGGGKRRAWLRSLSQTVREKGIDVCIAPVECAGFMPRGGQVPTVLLDIGANTAEKARLDEATPAVAGVYALSAGVWRPVTARGAWGDASCAGLPEVLGQERIRWLFGDAEDLGYLDPSILDREEEFRRRIEQNAGSYFSEFEGQPREVRGGLVSGSTYPILKYTVRSGGLARDVYVKFAPVEEGRNEGRIEFENLRRLESCWEGSGNYRSPRALDYWDDVNALLSEGVPGSPLLGVLLRENTRYARREVRQRLSSIVSSCGKWLRNYHVSGGIEYTGNAGEVIDHLSESIDYMHTAGVGAKILDEARSLVAELARRCRSVAVPVSIRHGDIAFDNILVDRENVYVIDLSYETRGVTYADVAQFCIGLETINYLPRHFLYDMEVVSALQDAFLSAYGLEAGEARSVLALYWILEAGRRMKQQMQSLGHRVPGPLVRVAAHMVRRRYGCVLRKAVERFS